MKNNLGDLNNYLFEELERLNDNEELQGDKLDRELKRSKTIVSVSTAIINNARLIFEAKKHIDEYGSKENVNDLLQLGNNNGS